MKRAFVAGLALVAAMTLLHSGDASARPRGYPGVPNWAVVSGAFHSPVNYAIAYPYAGYGYGYPYGLGYAGCVRRVAVVPGSPQPIVTNCY